MSKPPLVIRADAGTDMGTGHIMRCLALAQAWQDHGGNVTFVSNSPDALRSRLSAERISALPIFEPNGTWKDARQLIAVAEQLEATYVVVDGYHFGADYQRWLKNAKLRVLFIDDHGHAPDYCADWVLNQNITANQSLYVNRDPGTRLLLGTRYALIRREFWSWRDWQRTIPDVARRLVITMGGSDPNNVTLKILQALRELHIDELEVTAVVGGANPHLPELQAEADHSPHSVRLVHDVTDMPPIMAWADVAVSGGGSTVWELLYMGLPTMLVVLAQNQAQNAARLSKAHLMLSAGEHSALSPAGLATMLRELACDVGKRALLSRRSRESVDSRGACRIVEAMQSPCLRLRRAAEEDCQMLFRWANNPEVRQASFSSEVVSWETHVAWFRGQLQNDGNLFFVVETETGRPIGQVRFSLTRGEATISTSVDSTARAKGFGSAAIALASRHVMEQSDVKLIHAYIKPGNSLSQQAFAHAGYSLRGQTTIREQSAIHMTLGVL